MKFTTGATVSVCESYINDECTRKTQTSPIAAVFQEPSDTGELVGIVYKSKTLDFVPQDVLKVVEVDLFEHPELIPGFIMAVLDTWDSEADQYKELQRLVGELEQLGYTFDYYLDAEPHNLRKITDKEEWENTLCRNGKPISECRCC